MIPCPRCGIEAPDGSLACGQCGALLHADALRRLHEEAGKAEQAGDWERALTCLGHCLELLPPETRQYRQIQEQARRISHLFNAAPPQPDPARLVSPEPVPATDGTGGGPEAQAAAAGPRRGPARVWHFVADSVGLMLRGLTRPATALSMAVWVVSLSWLIGWRQALGFAGMVYVHEMGHLIAIRAYGFRFSWPFFVPFLGAFVLQGGSARPRQDAIISLAGPLCGLGVSVVLFWADLAWGLPETVQRLVQLNVVINLMNLLPFWILDGGRLADCSRRDQLAWLGGSLLALSLWPFSPFALLLGIGFLVRAVFWKEFEAVRPTSWRPREGRGEGMRPVLLLTVAALAAGAWMLKAMRP